MNRAKPADLNENEIADEIEPPLHDISTGSKQLAARLRNNSGTDPTLSGGGVDARWEDAETVGGSTATPGRNDLDQIGEARNVAYADGEVLKVGEKEVGRRPTAWSECPLGRD